MTDPRLEQSAKVDATAVLHGLGRRHHRVVTRAELRAECVTPAQIRRLLRARLMSRILPGIYLVGVPELDQPALMATAIALAGPESMTSHRTAAEIRGHLRVQHGEVNVLSLTDGAIGSHTTELPMPGPAGQPGTIVVHASESALPEAEFVNGWPATPMPRTLVDVGALHGPIVLGWAWDEAEYRAALDPIAIEAELRTRRAPGNQAVRKLLAESFPTTRPGDRIDSRKELAIARLIAATGLPRPLFNAWVDTATNRYRLDVLFPGLLGVEVDGPHHDLQRRNARDKDRDAELLAVGIPVVHFTTAKIESKLDRCRDQLLRAHAHWAAVANRRPATEPRSLTDGGERTALGCGLVAVSCDRALGSDLTDAGTSLGTMSSAPFARLRRWISRLTGPSETRAPLPSPERPHDAAALAPTERAADAGPVDVGGSVDTSGAAAIVELEATTGAAADVEPTAAADPESDTTTGAAADVEPTLAAAPLAPGAVAAESAAPLSPAHNTVATVGHTAGEVPLARSGTVGMQVAVEHRTTYIYDRPVQLGPQVIRLRPAAHCRTPILSYSLHIGGGEHFINWQQDPVGNYLARVVFPEPVREFSVTVDLVADMTVINPFDFFVEESAKEFPFAYDAQLAKELAPYLALDGGPGPLLTTWLEHNTPEGMGTLDTLVELNRRIAGTVGYSVRMEPGVQTPEVTLERAIGSCRDSAWLLVHALRNLGIAARFASGYLVQLAPDRKPLEGPEGPTEDFTDLHAWAEAYLPGAGWIGLDATSGLLTGEGHIPLACSAEPASAAPIAGSIDGPDGLKTEFEFANVVTRIVEPPRVTKPYSDEQWARVLETGRAVDLRLRSNDVRLTMGGEPTFVSATDMEGAEWNIDADGPTKYGLAAQLADHLAGRFATGALTRHAQGKWYPGEPLPRWSIGVHWRTDGEPLWTDRSLLADPSSPGTATLADATALAEAITAGLGIDADRLVPAYEDRLEQLITEARLPGGDPPVLGEPDEDDERLRDSIGRAALIAELDANHGEATGYALPLHRADGEAQWRSGRWTLRRGRLVLMPGDSPMGLRLPLAALTWLIPQLDPEPSRFATRPPLSANPNGHAPSGAGEPVLQTVLSPPPALLTDYAPPITALCVEIRGGHPRVFLPPMPTAEHAVELIGVVEQAAASLDLPVVIEGYSPPGDDRLRSLSVTPDPGVIEVNIHPSETWEELVDRSEGLDDDARSLGLATEKFEIDGLHSGTGGGSHLTLGGRTPSDSPFLRRPDLLRSMVTYWQHHPSLSYLFSGRFIGPTSQAPRVDEARHENLYELEIAFAEMERLSTLGAPPAWQVDRLLRNLLTDLTGNTHRAEFCIDKLYDPGSESGRLGVVELRGFEMPPHPQMSLVQGLLVRALVARLWSDPYAHDLVRWGTELHDKFLLPWWVEHDIRDVVGDLRRAGIRFESEWLVPFLAFRFPLLGETIVDGVRMELRMGVEPWHVLGEESSGSGTSRYVDSSVERLQLRVDEYVEGRHIVLCEGRPVPLQPTGTPGTYVAGIRYRAWQPWSALHPTIGIHSPLVFDLVDRWSERSLGGCTYHVVHPGGRGYDTRPVNASEAEARRAGRFEAAGHTPGPIDIPQVKDRAGEYPRTLDLRRGPRP